MNIVLRFKWHRCAFVADIEKFFFDDCCGRAGKGCLWVDDIRKSTPDMQVLHFT